ncbi:MAG TPA: outer membrane protein transport protein [Methylophilaceae bacterium]|nr:outer membrane protein transport protein [Methylophilaceae bacterium]
MEHTTALRQVCLACIQIFVFAFQLLLSTNASATNGINLIGFGAESSLMAGADTAVARDTSALNTNPAGLTQIHGRAFDGFGSVLRTFDLAHKDSFGNDVEASNKYTFLGGGGYAQSLDSLPCTVGVGLFAQGGAGGVFKDIKTAFGNSDELSSLFAIAKVIPGIGCQVNDKLSLGASLAIVYAGIDQKFFPNTSSAVAPFAGYDIEGASALRTGLKFGAMYQLSPQVKLAATYTGKTELPLTDGSLTADYSAQGLGKVKYRDASINGFALPREIAVGLAVNPTDKWLLSFKLNWINWSDAINSVTLRATDPVNPAAPAVYGGVTPGNWSNQLVFATGMAYTLDEKTTLYGGYNYGRNPVPDKNASPLLAAILEHHVTLGMGRQINQEWKLMGGMEYLASAKAEYTSPLFGKAEVRNEGLFLHFMLSRRW